MMSVFKKNITNMESETFLVSGHEDILPPYSSYNMGMRLPSSQTLFFASCPKRVTVLSMTDASFIQWH